VQGASARFLAAHPLLECVALPFACHHPCASFFLCQALLEWMDGRGVSAMFATHLHEIRGLLAKLPQPLPSLSWRRLQVARASGTISAASPLHLSCSYRAPPLNILCIRTTPTLHLRCTSAASPLPRVSASSTPQVELAARGEVQFTFKIEEGICLYSHALHTAHAAGLPPSLLDRAASLIDETRPDRPEANGEGAAEDGAAVEAAVDMDGIAEGAAEGATSLPPLLRAARDAALPGGGAEAVHVPPGYEPPPPLFGRSCLYLLQVDDGSSAGSSAGGGGPSGGEAPVGAATAAAVPDLYVGESDAIGRRLEEHRKRFGAARVHCVVLEVGSKSEAIELEARAVSRLQQLGLARVLNVQVGKGKAR
jgi:hypothetical protein